MKKEADQLALQLLHDVLVYRGRRRLSSNPSRKCAYERPRRGTVAQCVACSALSLVFRQ